MGINRRLVICMIYQALYWFSAHSGLVEPANKDRKIESIKSGNLPVLLQSLSCNSSQFRVAEVVIHGCLSV